MTFMMAADRSKQGCIEEHKLPVYTTEGKVSPKGQES